MTKEEIIQKGKKKFPPDIIKEIREDGSIVRTDVNATVRHAYIQGLIDNNCQLPSNIDEAAENRVTENGRFEITQFEKMRIEDIKFGAKWMAGQGWHDITETPSIFGVYLVIHEKGWCVANYMGKGTVCESGWVEVIHHIEIERPQKWLDLRDLIPKKQ